MKSHSSDIWRKCAARSVVILALFLVLVTTGCSSLAAIRQTGCCKREGLDPKIGAVIDEFRASVSDIMHEGLAYWVPGLIRKSKPTGCAVALVDEQGIIWTEGFGYTDHKRKTAVTPHTLFAIQSVSKTFTATAIMLAVQDGLLDLDEPITTYLPDFRVYSRYEEHPERKITLRHLLSHTAGLTSEAPVGNIAEWAGTFQEHVKSIYGTWLMYPVGQAYHYSNIGMDLAAYTLQVVSGASFEQYMKQRLFRPLGLNRTTLDHEEVLKTRDRAVAQDGVAVSIPIVDPLLGSGGVYTSATDLARFVQFHINRGELDGKRILAESACNTMYTPRADMGERFAGADYGLGIYRWRENDSYLLCHGGGTIGWSAMMLWYPEYGIGAVAFANSTGEVPRRLATTVADKLLTQGIVEKHLALPEGIDAEDVVPCWKVGPHTPTPFKRCWREYIGTYRLRMKGIRFKWYVHLTWGLGLGDLAPTIKVRKKGGYLCLTQSKGFGYLGDRKVQERLEEVEPGLFFTASGECLDLRGKIPTWSNYRLKKQ